MHGIRVAGVVALAATALMPVAAQEPKPADPPPAAVIEKHVAAIGGREALRAVKTMVVHGRNASLGAADRPLIRYLKHPNLLRQQDTPGAATFIVSDGSKVFQVGGSGQAEVTQAWASPLRHTTIDDGFLDDGKLGIRYEHLGTEAIKTGPWKFHHLRRVFRDGYTEDLYFEAESGLLRMRIEDNGRAKRVYYDYRHVGGIRYPFVTATVFDGFEPPHLFIVDEVTLNVVLGDAFFLKGEMGGVRRPAVEPRPGAGVVQGPYLGQKPPGMTPEIFAPGIVSTKDAREFSGAFQPARDATRPLFEFASGANSKMGKESRRPRLTVGGPV